MLTAAEGHPGVDIKNDFSVSVVNRFPFRLYNKPVADINRFEILLPVIFPIFLTQRMHFNSERAELVFRIKSFHRRKLIADVH